MIKHLKHSNLLEFEILSPYADSLFHFTTTIEGGVSRGNYATFNLGLYSGDDTDSVLENRRRLVSSIGVDKDCLITPYQTHEDNILVIDPSFLSKSDSEQTTLLKGVDSVVTDQKGICIAVGTADCAPILLFDPVVKIFGVVHAGWRGTVSKLVEKTIFEMQQRFGCNSSNLIACIGPSISQEYFEVGEDVVESFLKAGFPLDSIGYEHPETKKTHIDLWFANELLLAQAGVLTENTETADLCTYSNKDLFFSARRQTIYSGRMLTGGFLI